MPRASLITPDDSSGSQAETSSEYQSVLIEEEYQELVEFPSRKQVESNVPEIHSISASIPTTEGISQSSSVAESQSDGDISDDCLSLISESSDQKSSLSSIPCFCCTKTAWGLAVIVPIYMFVIGSVYYHDCVGKELIPQYLMYGGAVCLGFYIGMFFLALSGREKDAKQLESQISRFFLFTIAWYILGCCLIFPEWTSVKNQKGQEFCNEVLYWSGVVILLLPWGCLSILILWYLLFKICEKLFG